MTRFHVGGALMNIKGVPTARVVDKDDLPLRIALRDNQVVTTIPPSVRLDMYREGWIGIHAINQEGIEAVLPLLVLLRQAGLNASLAEMVPEDSARIMATRTKPRVGACVTISLSSIVGNLKDTAKWVELELEEELDNAQDHGPD